jgi:hypothetical protein
MEVRAGHEWILLLHHWPEQGKENLVKIQFDFFFAVSIKNIIITCLVKMIHNLNKKKHYIIFTSLCIYIYIKRYAHI